MNNTGAPMPKNLLAVAAVVALGVLAWREIAASIRTAPPRAAATTPTGLLDYNERQFQIQSQAPAYVVQDWSYE